MVSLETTSASRISVGSEAYFSMSSETASDASIMTVTLIVELVELLPRSKRLCLIKVREGISAMASRTSARLAGGGGGLKGGGATWHLEYESGDALDGVSSQFVVIAN